MLTTRHIDIALAGIAGGILLVVLDMPMLPGAALFGFGVVAGWNLRRRR